jgi:hypothetical protein
MKDLFLILAFFTLLAVIMDPEKFGRWFGTAIAAFRLAVGEAP